MESFAELNSYLSRFDFLNTLTDETYDHEAAVDFVVENVALPSFYTFDTPTPVYTLFVVAEDDVQVIDVEGNIIKTVPEGLSAAYDYAKNELGGDVKFAGDLKAATGKDNNLFVSVPGSNKNSRRLLISHTDKDEEWLAKSHYLDFLRRAVAYRGDPLNFVNAWHFVDSHPAFYSRYKADDNRWSISNNSHIWTEVALNDDGETVIMLEAGGSVEPERTQHYHDTRLDIWAPTYEAAYVSLAALVDRYFDLEGGEREGEELTVVEPLPAAAEEVEAAE